MIEMQCVPSIHLVTGAYIDSIVQNGLEVTIDFHVFHFLVTV